VFLNKPGNSKLYHADNYELFRRHVRDKSVDLVSLDQPFNSHQGYNVLLTEKR
jgi:hypothetical protein